MRSVPEWIGKTHDTPVPPRVRLRVFERNGGICHLSGRVIRPGDRWEVDHVVALANGGEHRESNLAPVLVKPHRVKTAEDVREKAKIYRKKSTHLGIKRKSSRPIIGSRASGYKRGFDGKLTKRTPTV